MAAMFSVTRNPSSPFYSLKDREGAVVCRSDDAATLIQQALDGPVPAGFAGFTILLGDGDFSLTSQVVIRKSNVCIKGNGVATRLVIGSHTGFLVDAQAGELGYIEIICLTIEGTYDGISSPSESVAIRTNFRTAFLRIRDVTILSCRWGMLLYSLWKPRFENITIRSCRIGIETWGGQLGADGNKLGCEFRMINSNIEAIDNIGIWAHDNAGGLILSHVEIGYFRNSGETIGLLLEDSDWAHLTAVLVDWFRLPAPDAPNPAGVGYKFNNVRGVQLANCWAGTTGGCGMRILNSKKIMINGMQFRQPGSIGVYAKGIPENKCEEITITSCQFSEATDVAIWLDNDVFRSRISGNIVSHCLNGIKETGNSDYNEFGNNEIWGGVMTTPLQVSGGNSHEWHNRTS